MNRLVFPVPVVQIVVGTFKHESTIFLCKRILIGLKLYFSSSGSINVIKHFLWLSLVTHAAKGRKINRPVAIFKIL
jgi:hypothetical protein